MPAPPGGKDFVSAVIECEKSSARETLRGFSPDQLFPLDSEEIGAAEAG